MSYHISCTKCKAIGDLEPRISFGAPLPKGWVRIFGQDYGAAASGDFHSIPELAVLCPDCLGKLFEFIPVDLEKA